MVLFHELTFFLVSCLVLFLLTTLQVSDVFAEKPVGEHGNRFILVTYARNRGTVLELTSAYKHETNQLQTTTVRRPPSGPNPEGNFEVNALSKDTRKHGAKVQNVKRSGAASMTKKNLHTSTHG
ncbi:hypothetical protein M758_UG200100 [Ceratodon purpureus]|nr:hypothetical protein M758_UG200100 [Ceratodon purpureus]